MCKSYSLKKWYPSLPKEMNVGFEVLKNDNLCNYSNPQTRFYPLSLDEVENNPEFWEIIKGRKMFKTTDNKTVFVGDEVIYVDDCFELFIDSVVNDSVKIYDYCFLDIESAKAFVNLNRPRYSLKDILDSTVVKYNTSNILLDITKLKLKK